MRLASLPLFAAVLSVSAEAAAAPCLEAISEAMTRKIFDALAAEKPSDGCALEAVATDKAEMKIIWKKGDVLLDAVLVLPSVCARSPTPNSNLTAIAPIAAERACPAAIAATRSVVEAKTVGDLVPVTQPVAIPDAYAAVSPLARYRIALVAGGGVVVVAATGLALLLARRRRRHAAAEPAPAAGPDGALARDLPPRSADAPEEPPSAG